MRRTMTALVAVGVLVLGACGGDDDDAKGTGSKDDSSTDAGSSGSGSANDSAFCKDVVGLLNGGDSGSTKEAIAAAKKLDPPKELAKDWDKWLEGIEALDTANPSFDPNDPSKAADYQEMSTLTEKVFSYIQTECGMPNVPNDAATTSTTGQT